MYYALDVAKYIITYSNQNGYKINNLKLQKLLYYVQAFFLIKTEKACFKEEIEAWQSGPFVPGVYSDFKWYGSEHIPGTSPDFDRIFTIKEISQKDKERIQKVVDGLSAYSASDLLKAICQHDPWKSSYYSGNGNNIIPKEKIKEFFMVNEKSQEKNNMKLGQFLRQQRISKGLPLHKAAELSGIDIIHVSDIERCRVLPSEEECQALSSLYECAVNMQDFDLETVSREESIFIFKDDCSTINEAQSNHTMK